MKKTKSQLLFICSVLILSAGVYLAWQLLGLRYTNLDDIYFNINAINFSGDFYFAGKYLAYDQARIQAFINIPIILWVSQFCDSFFYDVLNIGFFGFMYAGMIWALTKLSDLKNSLVVSAVTLILLPLHYYFTIPQGFPVMFAWGLIFIFVSAGTLRSYLQQPARWKLMISVALFIFSLWGEEFNFILHPALLAIFLFASARSDWRTCRKAITPYFIGWIVCVIIYLLFFKMAHFHLPRGYRPVHFEGFNFIAWLKTFSILMHQSFLPSALWSGVRLESAASQGNPEIFGPITFAMLWNNADVLSLGIVLIAAFLFFAVALYIQTLSRNSLVLFALFFICLIIIPNLVLALAPLYQLNVQKRVMVGHITSFYVEVGLSSLLFLFFSFICNHPKNPSRSLAVVLLSSVLAVFAATTFLYNNLNRQVMMANKQKWAAMRELAVFIHSERQDLASKFFYAPAFWTISGVSFIPKIPGDIYWTEYTRSIGRAPIHVTQFDEFFPEDTVHAVYFATPSGTPVVAIQERKDEKNSWGVMVKYWYVTLIAAQPVSGMVSYARQRPWRKKIELDQWVCGATGCTYDFKGDGSFKPENLQFRPDYLGPHRLLAQFFLPRNYAYAHPLGMSQRSSRKDVSRAIY